MFSFPTRWLCFPLATWLLLVARPGAAQEPVARPTVAIASLKLSVALVGQQQEIETSIARGLREHGFEVQDLRVSKRRLAGRKDVDCRALTCLQAVAALTSTQYLVHGQINGTHRTYSVEMRFFDSTDGRQVSAEEVSWGVMDPVPPLADGIREIAGELAQKAQTDIQRERAGTKVAPTEPAPPIPLAVPSPALGVAPPVPPPDAPTFSPALPLDPAPQPGPEPASRLRRVAPWAGLALAGIALSVGGVVVRGLDGQGACDLTAPQKVCPWTYRTNGLGIAMLAVGGSATVAGIVGGAIVLSRKPNGKDVALALSVAPSSLLLNGSF